MTLSKFYFILVITASVMACSPATQEMEAEDIENSNRENKPQGPKGEAKFKDTVINFGKITDGEVVEHAYTFTNVGKSPISIAKVEASCGCTTPEYSKEIIQPGGTGKIKATFNSAGKGGPENPLVEKSISVYFDDCINDLVVLKFVANIYAAPTQEAQPNNNHSH